jgi:hypothetical protein
MLISSDIFPVADAISAGQTCRLLSVLSICTWPSDLSFDVMLFVSQEIFKFIRLKKNYQLKYNSCIIYRGG